MYYYLPTKKEDKQGGGEVAFTQTSRNLWQRKNMGSELMPVLNQTMKSLFALAGSTYG